jgi:hypothetical protein
MIRLLVTLLALPSAAAGHGDKVIRGVNLGGWLVLERWITPSLMESCMNTSPAQNPSCFWGDVPMDQWTYCAKLRALGAYDGQGDSLLAQRLHDHWDSWVTLGDVTTLARAGVRSSMLVKRGKGVCVLELVASFRIHMHFSLPGAAAVLGAWCGVGAAGMLR